MSPHHPPHVASFDIFFFFIQNSENEVTAIYDAEDQLIPPT